MIFIVLLALIFLVTTEGFQHLSSRRLQSQGGFGLRASKDDGAGEARVAPAVAKKSPDAGKPKNNAGFLGFGGPKTRRINPDAPLSSSENEEVKEAVAVSEKVVTTPKSMPAQKKASQPSSKTDTKSETSASSVGSVFTPPKTTPNSEKKEDSISASAVAQKQEKPGFTPSTATKGADVEPKEAAPDADKATTDKATTATVQTAVAKKSVPATVASPKVAKAVVSKGPSSSTAPAANPVDAVAKLLEDIESGVTPMADVGKQILEQEAALKAKKIAEYQYLGAGTVVGGAFLGLVLGSLVAICNAEVVKEPTNAVIVVGVTSILLGGGAYAAYFLESAKEFKLPEPVFRGVTISVLASKLLGKPTIRNFESVKKRITDRIDGVNTKITTSITDTKTTIVTLPDTIKAGVDMKVEEAKNQVQREVADAQRKIKAAPANLVDGAKTALSDAAFDVKEATVRATEETISDLQSLPSRTADNAKKSITDAADNFVKDVKAAPGLLADTVKAEVNAIPGKIQEEVTSIPGKLFGGNGTRGGKNKKM